MGPGIGAFSAGELSSAVGILGGLLYGFGGVMLIVMYSVTGRVDRAAFPASFSRTHGISAREMLNRLNGKEFSTKRTTLRGQGHRHLMGPYKEVGMCRPLCIETNCETRRRLYKTGRNF